jgi:hypothetical protein
MQFEARDAMMLTQGSQAHHAATMQDVAISTYTLATCCCPCSSDHAIAQASAQWVTVSDSRQA